jgi:hypothetical protein
VNGSSAEHCGQYRCRPRGHVGHIFNLIATEGNCGLEAVLPKYRQYILLAGSVFKLFKINCHAVSFTQLRNVQAVLKNEAQTTELLQYHN